MPIPQKHFYMIRHGETEHNAARLLAGHTDSRLTEKGRAQAKTAQNVVKNLNLKPEIIIHSNLSRARDTANIINEVLDIEMKEDADIAEHFCGDWEGKPYDECESMLTGWQTPPNGECFDDFCARIRRSKENALTQDKAPALIVCHGGVFRGFGRLYGLNTPGVFKNCHLYEFKPNPSNTVFPWSVFSYSYDGSLIRETETVFHDSAPLRQEDRIRA